MSANPAAGEAARPLVECRDLQVHFRTGSGRDTVKAVDGVSLAVRAGETFGVIGESGSGKSTLGRALVCLAKPTGGRLLHDGADPYAVPARRFKVHRRDYQIIFQDPNAALDPRMTILRSVREPLDIAGVAYGGANSVKPAGSAGFGVRLLDRLARDWGR